MEQIMLNEFRPPHKYIIDACSINAQKDDRAYRKQVLKNLWANIGNYMNQGIIVICSEVADEIGDKDIKDWLLLNRCQAIEIDDEIQSNVRRIVTEHPKMINFSDRASSSGDVFVIATAMRHGLIIITEETPKKQHIPIISKFYNVETVNIIELCEREKWVF